MQLKDPGQGHFWVSMAKSGVRIVAAICLYYAIPGNLLLMSAAVLLLIAEAGGIFEEMI
jgi:hypothetical protein